MTRGCDEGREWASGFKFFFACGLFELLLLKLKKKRNCGSMAAIPQDTWVLIGLHLKPRHLFKLLVSCKTVNRLVDNNGYWTRVAAHQVWRDFEGLEIDDKAGDDDVFPRIEHNLTHMLGLEHGYFWSMERFFQRLDEVIQYYSANGLESNRDFWASLACMSLEEKTRVWLIDRTRLEQGFSIEPRLVSTRVESMKEVAKEEMEVELHNSDRRFNRFVCEMEDSPMPLQYKREFFRKLDGLLWGCVNRPLGDSDGKLQWGCCHGMLAIGICKF